MDMTGFKYGKPEPSVIQKKRKAKLEERNERACRLIVWKRDGGRCRVPGCIERGRLEMHHITPRSRSSRLKWATGNNILLCHWHHQWRHAGKIQITGDGDGEITITGDLEGLRFRL